VFQSRQTLALFAQVLKETAERYVFEIRGLCIKKDSRLEFFIKSKDGFQLPRIMQLLKQTFSVRYNVLHKLKGHTWGNRYWSEILEGEPPKEAEPWTGPVMGVEAAEFLPTRGSPEAEARGGSGSGKPEGRASPSQGNPPKSPARPPPRPASPARIG
jgi:REP element-mobilizing transposase RayT